MKTVLTGLLGALILTVGTSLAQADEAKDARPWIDTVEAPQYFAVVVHDVDAAVAWYRRAFGLDQLSDESAEDDVWRIVNLSSGALFVEIIRDDRNRIEPGKRVPKNEFYGFAKVGFSVANVIAVADRVEAATGTRPRVLDFERFGIQLIQIKDPEGNTIQLSSPMHGSG
jgi:predicted enzyme related to lactoylglutathione lyase